MPAERDRPWVFRTYSGHSSARASNALYRQNLAKGQTGLSVAFDLPTQTGFDSDHPLARGEVGKVGVPICHLEDLLELFDGLPLDRMNTSMTINATAAWLLALFVAAAERTGVDPRTLENVRRYLKLFWVNSSPYDSMTSRKFVMNGTIEDLVAAARAAARSGAALPKRPNETIRNLVTRLGSILFDPQYEPMLTAKNPEDGLDVIQDCILVKHVQNPSGNR